MTDTIELFKEFNTYNPLIFDISNNKIDILKSSFDIQFSNNICYPEFNLGFHHYIHQAKDKMEIVDQFTNRKKIYLVSSLFEKNIDYKEETETGIKFTSIDNGIKDFIKEINVNFPPLLNRAFLKMWEMIIFFNLIPDDENFTSSHLAEGPGSFIQATILYREMQQKLGKIKSYAKDNYFGITLHSDHEHLLMHQDFIKYFSKEKPNRLHIMETKSLQEIKDMYGGGKNINNITNGDLTKINTIKLFGGSKNIESFAKPSFLITSDGGFDWKKENLQEQEAYCLIFGEIVTALKLQEDGGNFVIKIFESFTKITIKMIELLKNFYSKVYICKPYTSRISNSEKYIVCKGFKKSLLTTSINKKLEDIILNINKNEIFNILDIFTDIEIPLDTYKFYKTINSELLLKQYIGINNIVKFINLDNYNGVEFNEFLDKQIIASHFWNNMFLNTSNYSKIYKYFNSFDFIKYKNTDTKNNHLEIPKISRTLKKGSKSSKKSKKSKIQKGGKNDSDSELNYNDSLEEYKKVFNDTNSIDSEKEEHINLDDSDIIDLNNININ